MYVRCKLLRRTVCSFALHGNGFSATCSGRFILGDINPLTQCVGGWGNSEPVWVLWRRQKSLFLLAMKPQFFNCGFSELSLCEYIELQECISDIGGISYYAVTGDGKLKENQSYVSQVHSIIYNNIQRCRNPPTSVGPFRPSSGRH
jgi:hypothetical protein